MPADYDFRHRPTMMILSMLTMLTFDYFDAAVSCPPRLFIFFRVFFALPFFLHFAAYKMLCLSPDASML